MLVRSGDQLMSFLKRVHQRVPNFVRVFVKDELCRGIVQQPVAATDFSFQLLR